MKRSWGIGICIAVLFSCTESITQGQDGPATLSGFAERDITPEIGLEQPGGYGKVFHKTIHDPCKARAAVFSDGKTTVALVSVDALIIRRETVVAIRERIEKACGIPGRAVLIHATHSHSSGPTGLVLPGEYDAASDLVKKLAYEESSAADPGYLKHLENQIVDAVVEAHKTSKVALCTIGSGHEDEVAFNRRFRMRNGLTFTHPRTGNPDIIEPAGPTDPEVGVIGVWDADQKLVGCLVNFACHATLNPGGASANYIYYLEQVIRGVFGEQTIVVFLNGASGDITQVENQTPYVNRKPEQWARYVGGSIGAEAVKVLLREEPGVLTPIAFKTKTWKINRRIPRPERVAECLEIVNKGPAPDRTRYTFAKEILMLDHLCKQTPAVEVEVQAVQIGPAVFLTDPAEFFCEMGLQIKAGSEFPFTFPVSLANGCVGYVPTPESFGPRGGGYETRLTCYSNLEPTAGKQFVDAAIELSQMLKPGVVPRRAPAPPYRGGAWDYGSLPPELD
jgi:neutral ceramidase